MAHDPSGSRSPCSRGCTGEFQTIVNLGTFVTDVYCLDSSFSVLQKLEVVQDTTYIYFKDWVIPVTGPSCPSCGCLDQDGLFKTPGNMAHLKYVNPFAHKVPNLFHLPMNQ